MYEVRAGFVYYNGRKLSTVDEILIDTRQSEEDREGEVRGPARLETLPHGDYLFVTPDLRVVLLEEKRQGDLDNSWRERRLQRQLREALEANPDGITGLALRLHYSSTYFLQRNELLVDLAKLQVLGIPIVFIPAHNIVEHLVTLRAILQPGPALISPLAGDDRARRQEKIEKRPMSPVARTLRRALRGVGYERAMAWAEASGEDIVCALRMEEGELKEAGLPINVRRQLEELRSHKNEEN